MRDHVRHRFVFGGTFLRITYKVQLLTSTSCVGVVYTQKAQEVSDNSVQHPFYVSDNSVQHPFYV